MILTLIVDLSRVRQDGGLLRGRARSHPRDNAFIRRDTLNNNARPRSALEASSVTRSSPKILVVDDDPNITRALWRRFRSVGIEVIRSHHGKEGMVLAMTELPDVIITDYKMPGISGEGLLMNL